MLSTCKLARTSSRLISEITAKEILILYQHVSEFVKWEGLDRITPTTPPIKQIWRKVDKVLEFILELSQRCDAMKFSQGYELTTRGISRR